MYIDVVGVQAWVFRSTKTAVTPMLQIKQGDKYWLKIKLDHAFTGFFMIAIKPDNQNERCVGFSTYLRQSRGR